MTSLLQLTGVLFFTLIVIIRGQEQDPSQQQLQNVQQQQQQQQIGPQLYIREGQVQPNKQIDQQQGPSTTTVCVELRNGQHCVPQVQQQPQFISYPYTKDLLKPDSQQQQQQIQPQQVQQIQPQPSEQKPVVASTISRYVPQQPQPVTLYSQLQPIIQPQPQLYRNVVMYPQQAPSVASSQTVLYPKQYIVPNHPNVVSDGSLTMNCRVNGLKVSDSSMTNISPSNTPHYNNLNYRFSPPMMSVPLTNSYKTMVSNEDNMYNWNPMNPYQWFNPYYPQMQTESQLGRSSEDFNGNSGLTVPSFLITARDASKNPYNQQTQTLNTSSIVEDNKRRLAELRKQIESLRDWAEQKSAQNEPESNNTQNIQQPVQNFQQPPNPPPQKSEKIQQPQAQKNLQKSIKQ